MQSKLPEELKKQIKIEANEIYWQTHKASIARDPYTRGLTMFEVAQVPLINALIEKEERYLELKERCEKMEAALEAIKYKSLVVGQPGCTWGDTNHDSMSVAAGFNEALTECIRIADKAVADKGATLHEGINATCTCGVQFLAAHGECANCPGRHTRYINPTK